MKKLFKVKLELIQLIDSFILTILMWSINDTYKDDYRIMILCFIMVSYCIFSILAYEHIKEFRKEVLRRW